MLWGGGVAGVAAAACKRRSFDGAAVVGSGLDCCHGGVRGASSSSSLFDEPPGTILVEPPAAFSPVYEVITIWLGSMISRSSTFPNESKCVLKAPLKRLEPIELPKARPCSAT